MHDTVKKDYVELRAKHDELLQVCSKHEKTINELTEKSNWQEDSKYMHFVRERILQSVQIRHASYLEAFLSEKQEAGDSKQLFDPIELALYICRRLQTDNDWLVDKLASVEKQRVADENIWT